MKHLLLKIAQKSRITRGWLSPECFRKGQGFCATVHFKAESLISSSSHAVRLPNDQAAKMVAAKEQMMHNGREVLGKIEP
jgi:hypothetical protein